jgi:hypothetical protein
MPDLARLEEETAFERLALETGTPLTEPQYGWVDLRTSPLGDVGFMVGTAISGTEAVDRLRAELRPLLFGAAWKILDVVIERAIPARKGHWPISEKVKRARRLDVPVWSPFVKSDAEWVAALQMYANTEQLRHGIVHRRAEVTPSGELRVANENQPGQPFTMTDEEQLAFCRAARRLIDAIVSRAIWPRERDDLAFQLGKVHQYSGLPATGRDELRTVCEIHVNLKKVRWGRGRVKLDVPALQPTMRQQEGHRAFDVVAYLPNTPDGATLIGKLETAPVEVLRFRPDRPPAWLSSTAKRHTLQD